MRDVFCLCSRWNLMSLIITYKGIAQKKLIVCWLVQICLPFYGPERSYCFSLALHIPSPQLHTNAPASTPQPELQLSQRSKDLVIEEIFKCREVLLEGC